MERHTLFKYKVRTYRARRKEVADLKNEEKGLELLASGLRSGNDTDQRLHSLQNFSQLATMLRIQNNQLKLLN